MVSKEKAFENYICILKYISEEYNKILPEVFEMNYLKYKPNKFFDENDPFKLVLQWNFFFRNNMKIFYLRIVEDELKYLESIISNNKFNENLFNDKLNYLKMSCEHFKEIESKNKNDFDTKHLSVEDTVKNTLSVYNKFKLIQMNRVWFMNNLDFKYSKKFYMPNTIYNLANSLNYSSPDIIFSKRVENHIREYLLEFKE